MFLIDRGGVARFAALLVLAAPIVLTSSLAFSQEEPGRKPGSAVKTTGLPVPRFVSLKSDRVNVRKGPSTDHAIDWIFRRAGLPVEITAEFEHWRKIRDSEGAEGWVFGGLLSGRRTALVTPWARGEDTQPVSLHDESNETSRVVARLRPGVLTNISSCDGTWCRVALEQYEGFVRQDRLWGVYKNERIE